MTSPSAQPKCILELVDLHDQAQADELLRQRLICGWDDTQAHIDKWRNDMDTQVRGMFWIKLPPSSSSPSGATATAEPIIGHISLDSITNPPDAEVADPLHKSVLTINTLFILPGHRSSGLGRAAFEQVERYAQAGPYGSPNCKALTVNALHRRYVEEDEWRRYMDVRNLPNPPKGRSNEDWYVRMGYVKWKEEPRYPVRDAEGREEEVKLLASFLKKRLG